MALPTPAAIEPVVAAPFAASRKLRKTTEGADGSSVAHVAQPDRHAQAQATPVASLPADDAADTAAREFVAREAQPAAPAMTALVAPHALPASDSTPLLQPAEHAHCPVAPHPPALRERGIEGRVVLRVHVDALGRAGQAQVVDGSGWRLFDAAALASALDCRFVPARRDGQPVDSWVEFTVRFALRD